jgi:hypothetical protein
MRKDISVRVNSNKLGWEGNELFLKGFSRPLLSIVLDAKYSSMWRVRVPKGRLTDMVNRTRAKDSGIALQLLDRSETPPVPAPIRLREGATRVVAT